jgi:hypothetical protein
LGSSIPISAFSAEDIVNDAPLVGGN